MLTICESREHLKREIFVSRVVLQVENEAGELGKHLLVKSLEICLDDSNQLCAQHFLWRYISASTEPYIW